MDMMQCGMVKKPSGAAAPKGEDEVREGVNRAAWSTTSRMNLVAGGNQPAAFCRRDGDRIYPNKVDDGTTIAEDNKDAFKVIEDPFGSGKKIGIIKALNPDLSIIHGYAADRYGNTILCQAIRLSMIQAPGRVKNPVVVTVEKLVLSEYIRKHSPLLVKIPGYRVSSVSVAPFGAQSQLFTAWR